jgi:hypothetical protein
MQNREISGPSRNSSTTTAPPSLSRQARACSRAAARSSVTTTPLPAASPSSLTTWVANEAFLKRDGQRPGVLRDRHRRVLEEVPLLDAEPRRG